MFEDFIITENNYECMHCLCIFINDIEKYKSLLHKKEKFFFCTKYNYIYKIHAYKKISRKFTRKKSKIYIIKYYLWYEKVKENPRSSICHFNVPLAYVLSLFFHSSIMKNIEYNFLWINMNRWEGLDHLSFKMSLQQRFLKKQLSSNISIKFFLVRTVLSSKCKAILDI